MSTISTLEFWTDPGYMEGSVVVPQTQTSGLSVTPPNYLNFPIDDKGINVPTGEMFSSMTIKGIYADLLPKSYLRVTFEMNNSPDLTFYGWIDSVSLKSDTDNNPVTVISWHVDLWRTYLNSATYGYGLVTSRPASSNDPPQSLSYRYRLPGEFKPLAYSGAGSNLNWVFVTYTAEKYLVGSYNYTLARTMVFPVDPNNPTERYDVKVGTKTAVHCPSMSDVINSKFDEVLGIPPSAISSAFISPFPPLAVERVDGTTVYLATASAGSTFEKVTKSITTLPNRIASLTLRPVPSDWSGYVYFDWTDSEGNSGSERFSTDRQFNDWLRDHPGDVSDSNINAKINGTRTSFLWYYDINSFISSCLGNQYTPVLGDTFEISRCYHTATTTYNESSWYEPSASGTLATNLVFTFDGTNWNAPGVNNRKLVFDRVPTCRYSYTQGAEAFVVDTVSLKGGYGYVYTGNGNYHEHTITLETPLTTTDTKEWIFTDMNGTPLGSIPWGITISQLTVRTIVSATSGYIEFRENIDSHAKGTSFVVPLQAVDITSNSWSDYVYSGQREYDITQRKIAAQQALVSGVTSSFTGGISNAIMASIGHEKEIKMSKSDWNNLKSGLRGRFKAEDVMGLMTGNDLKNFVLANTPSGSFTGRKGMHPFMAGAASIGVGIGASLADYMTTQHFNSELQKAEDMLQAKQIDSITVAGSGWDWLWHGRKCGFISMVADDYSLSRFSDDKRLNGIYCSEPTENCNTLIQAGGPLRIIDLEVFGNIPVEARAYIKGRFANGVRILDR